MGACVCYTDTRRHTQTRRHTHVHTHVHTHSPFLLTPGDSGSANVLSAQREERLRLSETQRCSPPWSVCPRILWQPHMQTRRTNETVEGKEKKEQNSNKSAASPSSRLRQLLYHHMHTPNVHRLCSPLVGGRRHPCAEQRCSAGGVRWEQEEGQLCSSADEVLAQDVRVEGVTHGSLAPHGGGGAGG